MKHAIRPLTTLVFLAGCIGLVYLSKQNTRLGSELSQLDRELGRMSIIDPSRVYLVEIEKPDVPPEVASHVKRVWQIRCYLPPSYDYMEFSGDGRVAMDGIYHRGGFGSSSGSPKPEAQHKLLTLSFQTKNKALEVFYSFGGSTQTTTWSAFNPDRFDDLVIQKLVSSDHGPRSFGQDVILPLLKIYDPSTAEDMQVAGNTLTTFTGGLILLCPKSREPVLKQLCRGETPSDFEPNWVATELSDE